MSCHPRMLRVIKDLVGDWRRVDERIEGLSSKIEALARQDKGCGRLMTVPALGRSSRVRWWPRSALEIHRDFGAWLGLVPKQISTGDRTILASISKRGNR